MTNSEPGIGSGRRRPEASGSPERHPLAAQAGHPVLVVADDLERGHLELEPDALLLGVVDLLRARGQLVVAAPIDDDRVGRAQPAGRPHRIHRHVPAADDDDPLAVQDGGVAVGAPGAHEVDPGQVLVRGVDALEVLAGDVHEHRQPGTDREEDGVEPLAQLVEREGLADDRVGLDRDAGRRAAASTSCSTMSLGRRNSGIP